MTMYIYRERNNERDCLKREGRDEAISSTEMQNDWWNEVRRRY